jgi:hypothetical protein
MGAITNVRLAQSLAARDKQKMVSVEAKEIPLGTPIEFCLACRA